MLFYCRQNCITTRDCEDVLGGDGPTAAARKGYNTIHSVLLLLLQLQLLQ